MSQDENEKRTAKIFYLCGLFFFFLSIFFPTTPTQVTEDWNHVVQWDVGWGNHLLIALEPLANAIYCFTDNVTNYDPGERGDSPTDIVARNRREYIERIIYSLPASYGWFSIWYSIFALCFLKREKRPRVYRFLRVAGVILLIAVPLLMLDFYRGATLWEGHFYLGSGAYLIVCAYILLGISFWLLGKPDPKIAPAVT